MSILSAKLFAWTGDGGKCDMLLPIPLGVGWNDQRYEKSLFLTVEQKSQFYSSRTVWKAHISHQVNEHKRKAIDGDGSIAPSCGKPWPLPWVSIGPHPCPVFYCV
jgi:hypothetical protein